MRLPDCCTLGSKILKQLEHSETIGLGRDGIGGR